MKKAFLWLLTVIFMAGCHGKRHDPTPVQPPLKSLLLTPGQNEICATGTDVSDTESNITFSWQSADNADDYTLVIKDLLSGELQPEITTSATHVDVVLTRNTPYSWYVISISTKTPVTAQSATWKFYNSGPGVVTYAPFPAELTSPVFGAVINTSTVDLNWQGSTVKVATDLIYDVYLGTSKTPPMVRKGITGNSVKGITVVSGNTYYWRVVTKDSQGNTSDSGLSEFSVK